MKFLVTFLLVLVFAVTNARRHLPEGFTYYGGCAWSPMKGYKHEEQIYKPLPYESKEILSNIPTNFSWNNINGNSLITPVRNQFQPNPCGSCWAIAATGALSDRYKITQYQMTNLIVTDIHFSPQYLLDCCMDGSSDVECGSCNGGSSYLSYQLMSQTGISDESCNPYIGMEPSNWNELSCDAHLCHTCNVRNGTCYFVEPSIRYYVEEYGAIDYTQLPSNTTMEEAMRAEIYSRGSISCLMYSHANSFENYKSGILIDNTHYNGTTHFISLFGFGQTSSGLKYWIGRNSFGTIWGENGFFMAQRGVNIYNMEEYCYWATLKM